MRNRRDCEVGHLVMIGVSVFRAYEVFCVSKGCPFVSYIRTNLASHKASASRDKPKTVHAKPKVFKPQPKILKFPFSILFSI